MLVLFGSYARGNWVEDVHTEGHTTHVYQSDFDILVAQQSRQIMQRIARALPFDILLLV